MRTQPASIGREGPRQRRGATARRLAVLAAGLSAACLASAAEEDGPRHAVAVRHPPREAPYDVEHYAIDIALDPAGEAIEATCKVRLWATGGALERVELDLAGLAVSGVRDERGRDLEWRQAGETLIVELAETLSEGDFVELAVDYAGDYAGRPARGLWFTDVEDGVATQVFTQGQCDDARAWFPCFDEPADRATSEVTVRMPAEWVAVAAGERIERVEHGDGTASEHWRMHVPHPTYLTTLVAGEFTVIEERYGDLPLAYLVEEPWVAAAKTAFAPTADVLAFLEELTGRRYPYAKYSQACVEDFPFGGMENISATTLTDTMLRDERGARDSDATGLIAHEAAHQWFGDLLTCADWSHIWLNEGFATYAELLYVERRGQIDEFRARVRDAQESYMRADVGETRRPIVHDVYIDPFDLFFGGHTYAGGASRLHLLRSCLGDELFFAGLRHYVAEHHDQSVVTADLRAAFEAVSGRDLGRFFEQWLYSGGYPEFEWGWSWADGAVRVDVAQVQQGDGVPPVFEVPVDIEVRTEEGSSVQRVELDRREQRFEFACPERPLWVHFDRFGWIPKLERIERPLEEWLAIASLDEDVNARRDALGVLGQAARAEQTDDLRPLALALIERLVEDPSRHVRKRAAQELAGIRLPMAQGALRGAAEGDLEASVRAAALDALAQTAPDPELAAFARAQFEAGFSWETMGAAARLLAAAAPEEAEAFLTEGLAIEAPHGALAKHLHGALGRLGTESAILTLRRAALDETLPVGARATAVEALGQAATSSSAVAAELARLLASTPHYQLQTAAIEALGRFEDRRWLASLEDFYATTHDARQRRTIERILRQPWALP